MDLRVYIVTIVTVVTLIAIGMGFGILNWVNRLKNNGVETKAIVIRQGGRNTNAILRYTTEHADVIEKKYPYSGLSIRLKKGSEVSIHYLPYKVKSFWIVGDKTPYHLSIACFVMACLPIVMLFIFLIVGVI